MKVMTCRNNNNQHFPKWKQLKLYHVDRYADKTHCIPRTRLQPPKSNKTYFQS